MDFCEFQIYTDFRISRFLDFRISGFPDSWISKIYFRISGFSDFRIPGFPDFRIPGFPKFIFGFPDFRIFGFPDSRISRFPDFLILGGLSKECYIFTYAISRFSMAIWNIGIISGPWQHLSRPSPGVEGLWRRRRSREAKMGSLGRMVKSKDP